MVPNLAAADMLLAIYRVAEVNWRIVHERPEDGLARALAANMEILLRQFTDDYPPIAHSRLHSSKRRHHV